MGVLLTPILPIRRIGLKGLRRKVLAFDAMVTMYEFLALVRLPDGRPLTDPRGRVTSHLVGLVTRFTRLMYEYGIKPVFVFDGPPPRIKRETLEARRRQRAKALEEWVRALRAGDLRRAFSKAVSSTRLETYMLEDAKRLLDLMGIPWVQAPSDAEAQAAYMAAKGDVWAVGTKDYDALLYGAPRMVRYVTLTGTEWLPSKGVARRLEPELIELSEVLEKLGITRQQLVDLAILVGTDFNPGGVKGIGPKRALKLIKLYGRLERLPLPIREKLPSYYEDIRRVYLKPKVTDDYSIEFRKPDLDGLYEFLVEEKGFSRERYRVVANRLQRISKALDKSLTEWL